MPKSQLCAQNQTLRADAAADMADRRATVANPFADIIQTAQKAPRPEPLRPANAARKAVKKATKTPVRSPIRRRDDKDEAALRKEVARLKRENFSLAARLNARAAAPQHPTPLPHQTARGRAAERCSRPGAGRHCAKGSVGGGDVTKGGEVGWPGRRVVGRAIVALALGARS